MFSTFNALMNSSVNPLKNLPAAQRYQISFILSAMWTLIFCVSFGAWRWYGTLTVLHLLMISGTLVTSLTFSVAKRPIRAANKPLTYRDFPAADGTTRYDDIWGT